MNTNQRRQVALGECSGKQCQTDIALALEEHVHMHRQCDHSYYKLKTGVSWDLLSFLHDKGSVQMS